MVRADEDEDHDDHDEQDDEHEEHLEESQAITGHHRPSGGVTGLGTVRLPRIRPEMATIAPPLSDACRDGYFRPAAGSPSTPQAALAPKSCPACQRRGGRPGVA